MLMTTASILTDLICQKENCDLRLQTTVCNISWNACVHFPLLSACLLVLLCLKDDSFFSVVCRGLRSCWCFSMCGLTCMLTTSPLFGDQQPLTLAQFTSQTLIRARSPQSHCKACISWQQEMFSLLNKRAPSSDWEGGFWATNQGRT